MEIIFAIILFFVLVIYILFFSVGACLISIKKTKFLMDPINDFFKINLIDKVKVIFDTIIILFYLSIFVFFDKSVSFIPYIFGIIGFLFSYQFCLMSKEFYMENKFDLYWQSVILVSLPLSIFATSVIEYLFNIKLPDYTSSVLSSVISLSVIKELCKNIFKLKYKSY